MSTEPVSQTPTPSDAAMAAAERLSINYLISHDHPDMDSVSTRDLARDIDYHFAPLREELARMKKDLSMAHDALDRRDASIDVHVADLATLRAENAKLRAALERIKALEPKRMGGDYWNKGDLGLDPDDVADICIAALAPERKETT